jgi:2-iminobutanoate/2-iminopropanoate deaminase
MDPAVNRLVGGDIVVQTERVLQNLSAILEASGSSLARALKVTVFLKDMNDFQKMNQVYSRYFPVDPPARTTVEAARLPLDILVEIDAIASVG